MKTKAGIKKLGILMIVALLGASFILANAPFSHANPETATFTSYIVWRNDNKGDYTFDETSLSTAGVYEISPSYATGGIVKTMRVSYECTGEVTMELSADNGYHYTPAVNGVTLAAEEYGQAGFTKGGHIRWRATVGVDSALTEVKISYSDTSGVLGGFGEKALSGFKYRKPIYITNGSGEGLFNYQLNVLVGSKANVDGYDVHCGGRVSDNFTGIRFTAADGETLLSYYRGDVVGGLADFYVKVPQIPTAGTKIYIYYGNNLAEDLSDGDEVFDFFDGFGGVSLDSDKWESVVGLDGDLDIAGSSMKLDSAKVISKDYEIKDGIIEYRVEAISGYEARSIIRSGDESDLNQVAYSSSYEGAEHCIAIGDIVKANETKAISGNTKYDYRVIAKGTDITFSRFSEMYAEEEASVTFKDTNGLTGGSIGLEIGEGNVAYYDYVRVRKYVEIEPELNALKAVEEEMSLPVFSNVAISEKGDLKLLDGYTEGSYVSELIDSPFPVRIMIPILKGVDSGLSIDISPDDGTTYKKDCKSDDYYYASKGDFAAGEKLRYRVNFLRASGTTQEISVQEMSLNYEPGDIFLISPNGDETWGQGYRKEIMWTALQYEENYPMKIEYSLDGGATYKIIAEDAGNTGSYFWKVPSNVASTKVKMRISDGYDGSINDTSDKDFSIVGAGDYVEDVEEEILDEGDFVDLSEYLTEAGMSPGAEPHEILIKIGDNYHSDRSEDARGSYKSGDIILVKPAGHNWSKTEKNSFLIIRVDMTKEKAKAIVAPKKVKTRKKDSEGNPIYMTVKKRAYKVNLEKFGLDKGKKNVGSVHRFLKGKVLSSEIMERK